MRIARPIRQTRALAAVLMAAFLSFTLPSQIAAAQEEPSDEELAQAYYEQGVEAFFNKNYSLAITYFQRANALDADPVVLYNISLAQSRLGNIPEALQAALQAQEMEGMPEDTALKNLARIRAFQLQMTAEEIAHALIPPEEVEAQAAASPSPAPPLPQQESGPSPLAWAGIGTASAGALAIATTGVLTLIVGNKIEEYNSARQDGDYEGALALQKQIGDQQMVGQILLYSGAGLIAIGGTLWAIDFLTQPKADSSPGALSQLSLSGFARPDGATLQVRWDF